MSDRIVITGVGIVSALGLSAKKSWENAIKGVSGLAPITLFDASNQEVKYACEVKDFEVERYLSPKEARRRDRFQQFASVASQEAIRQAGLEVDEESAGRVGVVVSSAIGGLDTIQDTILTLKEKGPRRVSPFAVPMLMANGASGMISIDNGYKGPSLSVASACASSADGIGIAWTLIKSGAIDVAITGGSETTISEFGIGTFERMGAMSKREGKNPKTPQPFDLNRDGFVMGEGSAVLVLEKESLAINRGANILAELASYSATADAYHITAPSEDGSGGAKAIRTALELAQVNPEEVGYINAHGTATQLNDISETRAIKAVFGDFAYEIPISSTKAMSGHMVGATGAFEAVMCVLAIRDNVLPPTINYETPDPDCDLDYIPNVAREKEIKVAVNNAFGFGGHNSVLVVKEYN
jgi:3-oxoacyl-[acyl-carrier-protein] synthase II